MCFPNYWKQNYTVLSFSVVNFIHMFKELIKCAQFQNQSISKLLFNTIIELICVCYPTAWGFLVKFPRFPILRFWLFWLYMKSSSLKKQCKQIHGCQHSTYSSLTFAKAPWPTYHIFLFSLVSFLSYPSPLSS